MRNKEDEAKETERERRERGRVLKNIFSLLQICHQKLFPRDTLSEFTLIAVLVSYQIMSYIVTFSYMSISILVYLPHADLTNSLILTPFVLSNC